MVKKCWRVRRGNPLYQNHYNKIEKHFCSVSFSFKNTKTIGYDHL